jgi:ABC-type Fe3+/spermidine/putrescine transport system ATPase subunit
MVECSINIRRGSFHLQIDCRFASEWTVIFGPSGAGKSTLLRVLAGLERGDATQIALDGREIAGLNAGARRIGLVAQQPALFPHLSVSANVGYGLHALEREEKAERVRQMLALVDGAHLEDRRIRALSGGEAQRVALARALAPMPRLLLMDEPFSALDGKASDALIGRLQPWLREHGVQVIQATHDATDAFLTGAEVALMRDGEIVAQGPAHEVLREERERLARSLQVAQKPAGSEPQ